METVRSQVDSLAIRKQEFAAADERLRALHASLGDAESRIESFAAKDQNLIELTRKLDTMTKQFDTLSAQSDELARKQLSLDSLRSASVRSTISRNGRRGR